MKRMKRIFIIATLLVYIYCTLESCFDEENPSNCQKHSIEISDISCYLFEEENEKYCGIYADQANLQKLLKQYGIGSYKEVISFREHEYDEGKRVFDIDKDIDELKLSFPEKDNYNKGDTIKMKEVHFKDYLTSNDIKIIKDGNTCYNQIGQNYKNLRIKSLNKSTCFNVDRFDENKNLIDCGYATINITYKDKEYQYFNCYQISDKNADPYFKRFYNEFYSNEFFQELFAEISDEFMEEIGQYLKVNNLKKRKLQNQIDYDFKMNVEDRYGNIIAYDKNGNIIDDPTKILYSSFYSFKIFLFLLNLLFLL